MGERRRGREAALQMLYQADLVGLTSREVVGLYWEHLASSRDGEDFANALVHGCMNEEELIDTTIRAASEHWRLERMPRVDRNILRLGVYELLRLSDVPRRVTLNEAVELARKFGTEHSPGFVNGVLDRIASESGKD